MTSYTILYNPHAGGGHGEENARKIRSLLPEVELDFVDITKIRDSRAYLEALPTENALVLAGGDGTLNRFLNDIRGVTVKNPLYYFAAGSGNDFQRDVAEKYPDGLVPLEAYIRGLPRVWVQGREYLFLNGIGYGIDGYCCQEGDRLREKTGKTPNYTAIAIKGLLFHYRPTGAEITVDGETKSYEKVWLAPTMNGRYYGGGMMPTPNQNRLSDDKTVSTMVFHSSGKLKTLMIFPSIFSGTHIRHQDVVEVRSGHTITVKFDRPTALQIDGETILNVTEYRVTAGK